MCDERYGGSPRPVNVSGPLLLPGALPVCPFRAVFGGHGYRYYGQDVLAPA
jgi:hypothetical protein